MPLFQRFTRNVIVAWRLPLREKVWFLLFFPYSGIIRASILMLPFQGLSRSYGQHYHNQQLSSLVTVQQLQQAWRIGKMAELAARYTPWQSKCLVQALMVRTLLGFYRIPYVLHLGATMTGDDQEPMKAHAWVKVGRWVVSGGEGHRAFAIVGTYLTPNIVKNRNSQAPTQLF